VRSRQFSTQQTLTKGVPWLIGSACVRKPQLLKRRSQARSGRHSSRTQRRRRASATVWSTALLNVKRTPPAASPTRSSSNRAGQERCVRGAALLLCQLIEVMEYVEEHHCIGAGVVRLADVAVDDPHLRTRSSANARRARSTSRRLISIPVY
jgi:hypothetical protein